MWVVRGIMVTILSKILKTKSGKACFFSALNDEDKYLRPVHSHHGKPCFASSTLDRAPFLNKDLAKF